VGRLLEGDRLRDAGGAAAVEYALMIGVIAAAIAGAVLGLSAQPGAGPNRFCAQASSNGFGCGPGRAQDPAQSPSLPWSEDCPTPSPSTSAPSPSPTDTETGEPTPCASPD
jgi:hypothetical protein